MMRFATVSIAATLCVSAAAQAPPSDAPAGSASAPQQSLLKPVRLSRFVPSGERRMISFLVTAFPDCSSRGAVVARLLSAPEHGKLEFEAGDSFAAFNAGTPYSVCNNKKMPGLMVHYQSQADYVGEDAAKIFVIYPDGWAGEWEYTFIVK